MRMTPPTPDQHPVTRFLVDLALHRGGLRQMFEVEATPRYTLLYLLTERQALADAGPLLIEPATDDASERYRRWVTQGLAIELRATSPFDDVAAHLRTLTVAIHDQAPPALLRYADARLYAGLYPVLGERERARLLGPIETMSGVAANRPWTLRQTPEAAARHVPTDEPFRLTHRHELSQQAWRESAMLQPLATRHDIPLERLVSWFRQLRDMDLGTECACLEACRRLACLGIDRPIDEPARAAIQVHPGSLDTKLATLEAHFSNASPIQEMVHG